MDIYYPGDYDAQIDRFIKEYPIMTVDHKCITGKHKFIIGCVMNDRKAVITIEKNQKQYNSTELDRQLNNAMEWILSGCSIKEVIDWIKED